MTKIDRQSEMLEFVSRQNYWQAGAISHLQNQIIQALNHPNVTTRETNEKVNSKETEPAKEETPKLHKKIYPELPQGVETTTRVKNVIEVEDNDEVVEKKVEDKRKEKKERQKNKRSSAKKLKIVGDSIVNSINMNILKESIGPVSAPGLSGPEAKYNRAYGSKYDPRALFPNNNQEYKIPQLLQKEMTDNLLIQASITEISNLAKIPKSNQESLYSRAQESSENTMKTVEKTLEKHPNLKIILMKRPPRHDNMVEESEFANFVLDCLGEKAKIRYGSRLVVAGHTDLYGEGTKDKLFGVKGQTQGYDGVHLRGVEGQEKYTKSVLKILKKACLKDQEARSKRSSRRQETKGQEIRRQESRSTISTSHSFDALN